MPSNGTEQIPNEPPPPYIPPEDGDQVWIADDPVDSSRAGESAAFLTALSGRSTHERRAALENGNESNSDIDDDIDSLLSSEDEDLHHAPTHRTQSMESLHREMEQFEIYDPNAEQSNSGPSFTARASMASQRFARSVNSKIITPVSRMLDPIAQFISALSLKFDYFISKFGNPLILKRLLYLLFVFLMIYVSFESGLLPGGGKAAFGGEYYDRESLVEYLRNSINSKVIEERLHYLSSMPHQAGTAGDLTLAKFVKQQFKDFGISPVELTENAAYISYPNETAGSTALELIINNKVTYKASLLEDVADPAKDQQPFPYIAFSASGNVGGPIIFVNYGVKSDFEFLKSKNVDLQNSIVFMRMGKMNLGLKVRLAKEYGAIGVVTFSEHPDKNSKLWPDGPDYTLGSVERGTAAIPAFVPGDILTPGWSSFASPKTGENDKPPTDIPVIPLSWKDAKPFLDSLKGHGIAVQDWSSDIPSIKEWWTGDKSNSSPVVKLSSYPVVKERHAIWNVFGKIGGTEQGELAIIIGAKRDSWCYGAVESNSGTAVLLELARIFGSMTNKLQWLPLRSIYFASWDGSNHNFAGSTEWVEYNVDELRRNGAIYISLDEIVSGKDFEATGHPLLQKAVNEVLRQVNDPATNSSIYNTWKNNKINPFSAPGDYLAFQSYVGMPSIELGFRGSRYPKNSCFDTFEWMKKYGEDENFGYHKAMTNVVSTLLMKLADDPVVPFDVSSYVDQLYAYIDDLQKYAESRPGFENGKLDLSILKRSVDQLRGSAERFNSWLSGWSKVFESGSEPPVYSVHRWSWNSHLVSLDKHMLDNNGVPSRPWFKHVIYGPQLWHPTDGKYIWGTFPAIRDFIEAGDWGRAQASVQRIGTILGISANKLPI